MLAMSVADDQFSAGPPGSRTSPFLVAASNAARSSAGISSNFSANLDDHRGMSPSPLGTAEKTARPVHQVGELLPDLQDVRVEDRERLYGLEFCIEGQSGL